MNQQEEEERMEWRREDLIKEDQHVMEAEAYLQEEADKNIAEMEEDTKDSVSSLASDHMVMQINSIIQQNTSEHMD